jgi:hypothetical protein
VRLIYPPGATPLDPNEIEGLLPNIGLQSELNAREEDNILRARRWALSPRNRALKSGVISPEPMLAIRWTSARLVSTIGSFRYIPSRTETDATRDLRPTSF